MSGHRRDREGRFALNQKGNTWLTAKWRKALSAILAKKVAFPLDAVKQAFHVFPSYGQQYLETNFLQMSLCGNSESLHNCEVVLLAENRWFGLPSGIHQRENSVLHLST
eukprot:Plantae.Rhodophyta-Rhodochaete_pulchella.ctg639.p2 GENE.Plantae.Rhodophyta-Rhodochaete_pulchella.ctg639~~Plantae.Rhodophyta-Rhodochaete_pulchella.ctg639.p2  ORF type:complete len:109 (-),score=9.92 Plantae.Rhodophyta-Rhodochaete_pulchella.ctg639:1163-1489(-)